MWDFEHEPLKAELATRYRIEWMMPSACAERLALPTDHPEAADIGLVPVAALATIPGLKIIPGCTIASKHKVRSILLVRRATQPLHTIRTVAADTSSRASLAYTRILFKRWWAADPEFIQHSPDLDLMLKTADAALLIGDPALFALEDKELRETRTSEKLIYHDLAEEWIALTGVPWISAVWAMRGQAYEDALHKRRQPSLKTIFADFQNSRDHGQRNTDALVKEWSPRLGPAGSNSPHLPDRKYSLHARPGVHDRPPLLLPASSRDSRPAPLHI